MVNDVYAMMTQSLSRDGQGGMRAPLDMSNFRVINVGAATQPSDAVSLSQFQTGSPIGTVVDFAGVNTPANWMLCYGQAVSRTTYAELYAAFGGATSPYGQGDGTTTFNLPDCRGRVVAGKDNMGGTSADRLTAPVNGDNLGSVGGAESHVLTVPQLPSHNHGGSTGLGGAHFHTVFGIQSPVTPQIQGTGGAGPAAATVNTSTAPDHTHTIPSQGDGAAHNNVQPTIVMNKIIKVSY